MTRRLDVLRVQVSRVTLVILQEKGYPAFHTFRARDEFKEDMIYRHLNPPRAFMIEIGRLSPNYDIQPVVGLTKNRHIRTYIATQKEVKDMKVPTDMQRFFVRSQPFTPLLLRKPAMHVLTRERPSTCTCYAPECEQTLVEGDKNMNMFFQVRALVLGRVLTDREDSIHFITRDFDALLQECCESLGLSKGFVEEQTGKEVGMNRFGTLQMCNHIFLAVLPHLHLTRVEAVELLQDVVHRNYRRLRQVGVIEVEIPVTLLEPRAAAADDQAGTVASPPEDAARNSPVRIRVVCA